MRNGNQDSQYFLCKFPHVLILPMRNGNTGITSLPAGREPSSYPTYEEWKLPNNNIIPKAI